MIRPAHIAIAGLWTIVHVLMLMKNGIVDTGEAEKYLYQADYFLQHHRFSSSNFWFYSVQIFLLIADKIANTGHLVPIIAQLVLHMVATACFFKLAAKLSSPKIALFVTILFLVNYPFTEFNFFLQTESVYYSLIIIFSYFLFTGKLLRAFAILAILSITRPTGILFIIPALLYHGRSIKWYYSVSAILLLGVAVNAIMGSGGELDFMLPYLQEHIICGFPELANNDHIKRLPDGNSFQGIVYYVIHNPAQFMRLAVFRFGAFFGLMRHYFSVSHNVFLAAFYYPLYIATLASATWWTRKEPRIFLFMTSSIFITLATTLLTCDDWHNRFFLAISPFVILLAIPFISASNTFFRSRY